MTLLMALSWRFLLILVSERARRLSCGGAPNPACWAQAGDVGYVPFAMGHYIQNTDDTTLRFLEMFKSDRFADVSLNQWLALTPPELVQAHLHLNQQVMGALHKEKHPVV
jgi:oxalate decarboxylase/phosphoglucose isomerase-like protein (cupin superfamily)